MHVKILGGSSTYANTGSCGSLVNYLQHEDVKNVIEGKGMNDFFSLESNNVAPEEVQYSIDNNKAKLGKEDAKFFSIVVSPSSEEIKKMGETDEQRIENLKNFARNQVMQEYAENFNKGLKKEDILFYGKIHTERNNKNEEDLHVHIIVSRKTADNKKKISPQTNHKNTDKGAIKGGFDRKQFIKNTEKTFDNKFKHERKYEDTFEYKNSLKNGSFEQKYEAIKKAAQEQREKKHNIEQEQEHKQEIVTIIKIKK